MCLEITDDQIAGFPPEAQAVIRALLARNAELEKRCATLEKRVAELEAKLAKNSRNSSKPPSAGHPHAKPQPKSKPKNRRRHGGQPGHQKFERALIPADECDQIIPRKPDACRGCGRRLRGRDPEPRREQVWDIDIRRVVMEYQCHRLTCRCGVTTCGQLPDDVVGRTGPVLSAVLVLLTSWLRTSRRRAAAFSSDVCGVPCSGGHVSELERRATDVLRPAYDELAAALPDQDHLGIDETPFRRGRVKTWLWTFVAVAFTVFVMRPTRRAIVLCEAIGEEFSGSINCDRAKMYFRYETLQWCWAHLKRDFQALIDSNDNQLKRLGYDLMRPTKKLFIEYAKCRDGTIQFETLQRNLRPVRREIENLLLRGFGTAAHGMCRELHDNRDHLWTFLKDRNVEPTNNASERSLRQGVQWRKLSYGTQSERGDRFVETLLTIIETCRQQNRSPFQLIRHALQTRQPTSLFTA